MNASAAVVVAIPPWLEEICARLRSNDSSLTNLNLNIRRLTPITLAYLCDSLIGENGNLNNTHLSTLNLVNSLVAPLVLQPLRRGLAHQPSLRVLHLSYNKLVDISELGIILRTNESLEGLFLNYNKIHEGIDVFTDALAFHNKTLKVLHLGKNCIDRRGAVAFATMLRHNTTLQLLSLIWNNVDANGIKELVLVLKEDNATLQELELDRNPGATLPDIQEARYWSLANQYGRYLLRYNNSNKNEEHQTLPDGLWPHVFVAPYKNKQLTNHAKDKNDQANRIYFFLQSKPDLLSSRRCRQQQVSNGDGDDATITDMDFDA